MTLEFSSVLPTFFEPLANLVDQGGPVVLLLLSLSVVAVALSIAKVLQFAFAGVGRFAEARKALDLWLAGRQDEARTVAERRPSILADIVLRLVVSASRPGTDLAALKEDIERICLQRINALRAYLRPLDMIAQTAPLIGLLGTVLGMIEAFQAMQGAGAAVDPSVLAGGIWVALLTTAVGLGVAIPVSAVVGWLDSRIESEQSEMEAIVTAFFTGAIADHGRTHLKDHSTPGTFPSHLAEPEHAR